MIFRQKAVALALAALIAVLAAPARADDRIEIFDAHLHYNWEPTAFYSLEKVLALFKEHRVTGILATSRPNDGTRALVAARSEGLWVVPFIRPYRVRADIGSWFADPAIYDLVQDEFKRGNYRGVGEFHISGKAAAGDWVKKTVDFAVANDLFLHAHADAEAVEILMGHNPKARIIWAHTGFGLEAERVAALLTKYPQVWGELSYRSRHRRGRRQADGGVARVVSEIPRPLPARLRYLDQRALGELRRHHGGLPRLARTTAEGRRRENRARECTEVVWRQVIAREKLLTRRDPAPSARSLLRAARLWRRCRKARETVPRSSTSPPAA